jgi:hypothetical protein
MEDVALGDCSVEYEQCSGCDGIYQCFAQQLSESCCEDNMPLPIVDWNMFASCAEACTELCGSLFCGAYGPSGTLGARRH